MGKPRDSLFYYTYSLLLNSISQKSNFVWVILCKVKNCMISVTQACMPWRSIHYTNLTSLDIWSHRLQCRCWVIS